MHEISLVNNILEALEEAFPGRVDQISLVVVKAGLLSNVQPILLRSAMEAVIAVNPVYKAIRLEVELLPVLIYCDACGLTTEALHSRFVCTCGKPSKNLVQGDELMISKVVFKD